MSIIVSYKGSTQKPKASKMGGYGGTLWNESKKMKVKK